MCCVGVMALTWFAHAQQSMETRDPQPPPTEGSVTPHNPVPSVAPDHQGAQTSTFDPAASIDQWPWKSSTLTGDWGGFRNELSHKGIALAVNATLDLANVLSGGQRQGFLMPYLIDANLSLDTQKMGLWDGGQVFVDFQRAGSTQLGSRYIPDFWSWDAIYPFTQNYTSLSQYWYQQSFCEGGLRLKLGKIDANADFCVSYPGLQFVNTAAYMPGVVVSEFPTYPNQAGGFEVLMKPAEWLEGKFGMFDGSTNWYDPSTGTAHSPSGGRGVGNFFWSNPGSYFLIAEMGPRWTVNNLAGAWNVGWFDQTGDSLEPTSSVSPSPPGQQEVQGPWGLYSSLSQELFKPEGATDGQKLVGFGQFGWSDPNLNASHWSLMGGASWQGIFPERPTDTAGVLVAYNQFSNDPSLTVSPGDGEMIVEGFYEIQLTPSVGIQPDLQYINQPSSVSGASVDDAWILTFRVSISF